MQESRLFRILYYLLDKGHTTAPELAEKFEVSVRTIYRDIDIISGAGIPIYAAQGRNGGIQMLDNYVLNRSYFTDGEKQEMLAALQSLSVLDNVYEKEMLTKLSALFQVQSENWFEVDFARWGNKKQDSAKFELLKRAVIHHQAAVITYVSSYGTQSKRTIHPLKFLYKAKAWYIKAYCTDKKDFRIFKFNRIVALEILEKKFTPVDFPKTEEPPPGTYRKIILRFPKEMAYRVYDDFEADAITVQEDGTLNASADIQVDFWLIGYLLSFGAYVEVIEPASLREILSKEAKKIYEAHKT